MRATVVVFAVCALCCAVGHAAILRSVIRSRTAPGDAAVPRPRLLAEIAWALVPIVALALLLTATWDRVARDGGPTPSELMKIAQ
jgi:hypothetical protein